MGKFHDTGYWKATIVAPQATWYLTLHYLHYDCNPRKYRQLALL